jgi:chromosome segregation ATPase
VEPGARQDLFGVDPNEFVAMRDRLAKELRASGAKDEANEVKALRRPTVLIWALNQVSRHDTDALSALVEASRAARDAQEEVLAGAEGGVLRDAVTARRHAISAVVAAARRAIEASGRSAEAQERELDSALNAIVGSARLTEQLERGELTTLDSDDADESSDLLASLAGSVGAKPSAKARARETAKATSSPRLRNAQEKLERHRADADEAAGRLREAEHAVKHAQTALTRAERDLAAAQRERERVQAVHARARDAVARDEEAVARLTE